MSIKVYQDVNTKRLFRVHAYGKVDTSTNGSRWTKCPVSAKEVNHWRRSGTVVRLNEGIHQGGGMAVIEQELACLERFMLESDTLRQLIPVHPTFNSAYERKNLQTVKGCMTVVKGVDEWDAQHLLSVINKGLTLPAKMAYRETIIKIRMDRLRKAHANLLAQSVK